MENYALRSSISSKNAILVTKFLFNDASIEIDNLTSSIIKIKAYDIILDI
jgi:hypothetical protein